jgi:hypothetical protein
LARQLNRRDRTKNFGAQKNLGAQKFRRDCRQLAGNQRRERYNNCERYKRNRNNLVRNNATPQEPLRHVPTGRDRYSQ